MRKSFVRCTIPNEIRHRCIDGVPWEVLEPDSLKAIQLREDYATRSMS